MFFKLILYFFISIQIFSINLTFEEKKWIKENKNYIFDIDIFNPNHVYFFQNVDAEISGVYKDFFEKISLETGLKFKINIQNRIFMQNMLIDKKGDIAFNVSKTPSREKDYFYIPTLNKYSLGIYSKKELNIDFNNLQNYNLGFIPSTSDEMLLKKYYPELINFTSLKTDGKYNLSYLDKGNLDGIIGKSNNDIFKDYNFNSFSNVPSSNLWMTVNKNLPILYSIIHKFKENFSEEEIRKSLLKERPKFYTKLLKDNPDLTYLKENYKSLKVLIPKTDNMLPLFYKSPFKYKGYVIDRLNELSALMEVPIIYTQNPEDEYDIIAVDSNVFLNNKKELYTPYYKIEIAIFSKHSSKFINLATHEYNQSTGFVSSKDIDPKSLEHLSKFKSYKVYTDIDSAIEALLNNEIYYLYGDFKIVSLAVLNKHLENKIKISGFFGGNQTLGFSVKNDLRLARIINKIFTTHLSENTILQNEFSISKTLSPNYKYILIVFSSLISIIAILFYFLKKANLASRKQERISRGLVQSFETMNELNDEDTGHHILRVNLYSKFLAEKLNLSKKFIKEIGEYSSLHDVGKIAIPDSILKKVGKLTEEEFNIMKTHVVLGHKLIQKMELGSIAENVVLYHHEKWDGTGYSFKLKGTDIPIEARIVGLADVYDALRQKRVYKKSFSHEEAVQIIISEREKHFDPNIVDIFLVFHKEFDKIFIEN
ncbi:MAG: HD domain-containing phosphohydrolase [Cetobacterium sp.]|uniref:HD domain-containing phosphohydrolase n=1 Tax=Cetobacterium sp. TaxID=2071632 RepID=UPI003F2DD860